MDDLHSRLLDNDVGNAEDASGSSSINKDHPIISAPLLESSHEKSHVDIQIYHRRWYVLAVYSLLAATQGGIWNTWGPIAKATEDAFGWADFEIVLLSNWGPITFVFSVMFLSWLISVKGLRWACLMSGFFIAGGTALRCITSTPPAATWMIHLGQILNGLAGPVCMGVPAVLSAKWFPPHQRTSATAISATFSAIGVGVSFIIGPYMVPEHANTANSTSQGNISFEDSSEFSSYFSQDNSTNKAEIISQERKDIMKLMYVECGWSVVLLLLMLIYFPAEPPKPPSLTASLGRLDFVTGIKMLLRNKQFWLVGMTYFIPQGVNQCWGSVLDVNLKPHGISQNEAGWLGFYSTLAGTCSALIIARFADIFSKHMKWFLLAAMVPASGFYLWFTLIFMGVAPSNTVSIYTSIIMGALFLQSVTPLFFEVTSEITFPIPEAVSVFVLTLMDNVSGLVFLGTQIILNKRTAWANWANVGCIVACIPLLVLFKESYRRLAIDEAEENSQAISSG